MNNQNVLIVGESGKIGTAIARELTSSGYNIFSMNGIDVTNQSEIDDFFKKNQIQFNHLVYSVSAPIDFKDIKKESVEDFSKQFDVQIKGLVTIAQKLLDNHPLQSIISIGSSCLFGKPPARLASYTTGKYALLGLTRSLALELASKKIRVNMISPGLTGEGLSKNYPEKFIELTTSETPLKCLVTGKDISKLVLFLLSQDAEYITGLNIPLDGGLHLM